MSAARTDPELFERLYRQRRDPWDFETSAYETAKYEHTIAALGERRYERAVELGCSIGVLTERLAERCMELVALDPSPTALAAARERLAGRRGVRFICGLLPEDLPAGPFDLAVCSEVLYYLSEQLLADALDRLERRLAPGAALIAVHWRPRERDHQLTGDEVHRLLSGRGSLRPVHSERHPRYLLEVYERA